jgi:hypothetical protein
MRRDGGGSTNGGGLIMPGGAGRGKTAADIVAERQKRQKAAEEAPGSGIATEAAPGSQRSFRPPPGFLDATMRGEEVAVDDRPADTEMMLNRLKANAGGLSTAAGRTRKQEDFIATAARPARSITHDCASCLQGNGTTWLSYCRIWHAPALMAWPWSRPQAWSG